MYKDKGHRRTMVVKITLVNSHKRHNTTPSILSTYSCSMLKGRTYCNMKKESNNFCYRNIRELRINVYLTEGPDNFREGSVKSFNL